MFANVFPQENTGKSPAQPILVMGLKHAAVRPVVTTEMNSDFYALFETAFICADRNLPSTNFPAMCDADQRKGAKILGRVHEHRPMRNPGFVNPRGMRLCSRTNNASGIFRCHQ